MSTRTPKGYFEYILAFDSETTGIVKDRSNFDPSYNPNTGEEYQAISYGMLILNRKLDILDKLYLEIAWNGKSIWTKEAEAVHGLSKEYLSQHGCSESEAVEKIGKFIGKYWGPPDMQRSVFPMTPIISLGHNVIFDVYFLRRSFDNVFNGKLKLNISTKTIDTFGLGFTLFETFNSDELFEVMKFKPRELHNALEDILYTVKSVKLMRKITEG